MPDWPRDIDPGLLLRLLRRAQRPGLSRPGHAQRIIARHLGMTARPVLAERLTARGQGVGDVDVPIVHARPPTAPAASAGPAAPPPAGPLVLHLTERAQAPVPPRTVVQVPEPAAGRGQQAQGLIRTAAGSDSALAREENTRVVTQAAGEAPANRPPSPPSTETVPSVQTAPSPETAPAPAVMSSPRSWELLTGSPGTAIQQADPAAAAVLPLVRGRPAVPEAATTDRPAGPPGSPGSEGPVRETITATLPVVTLPHVMAEVARAVARPSQMPAATVTAGPRAILPVVPEEPWPRALSPAAAQQRPPLPLAAGPAVPPAATAQSAGRTGAPQTAPAVPSAAARAARIPALPNGRPVPATTRAGAGLNQADIDRLTDTVHARLLRRLAIERERRGGAR